MINQLEKITKIYDLLALCSSYILKELKHTTYEFALFCDDDYDDVYDAIERYTCETEEKGCKAAFNELKDFMCEFLEQEVSIEKCYAIVKFIDDLIEVKVDDRLLGGKKIVEYSALNEQYYDCVKILPKTRESYIARGDMCFKEINDSDCSLFRSRRECACSKLDAETVNYMIWDKDKINKYPLHIYHIDEKHPISKHFYNREKIVFGVVPFTNCSLNEVLKVKFQEKTFYIEGMNKNVEEKLKQKYNDIYERSNEKDIDFLIFPEMLMTKEILHSINKQEEKNSPQFIVNGSIWENFTNSSVITDVNGETIFTYLKKEPFKYKLGKDEYREHLDDRYNKEYAVLEIPRIGRVGVCICKDLINEDVKLFHKYIGTDILIVPAYTKSMDLQASAENLSKEYNCIVIIANACSALGEKAVSGDEQRIGFISLPAKCNTDRDIIIKMYYQNACKETCNSKCVGRMITVDYCHTQMYDDKISYKIEEASF